jgi:hypothetical protein
MLAPNQYTRTEDKNRSARHYTFDEFVGQQNPSVHEGVITSAVYVQAP